MKEIGFIVLVIITILGLCFIFNPPQAHSETCAPPNKCI